MAGRSSAPAQPNTPSEQPLHVPATGPEGEILLCAARTTQDAVQRDRFKALLQQEVNWGYLLQMAGWHGLIPLLVHNLTAVGTAAVPPAMLSQLHVYYRAGASRNIFLTQKLVEILQGLQARGILALPLKGPVLAVAVYGDLSLRQFSDLDILVQEQDVLEAQALLLDQGFRQQHDSQTKAQAQANARLRYHRKFTSPDGKIVVELHWAFLDRQYFFPLELSQLRNQLGSIPLNGVSVPHLKPEALLLFLCAHGAKSAHRWARFNWICDVAELIGKYQGLDWREVIGQAEQLGCLRRLWLGLALAQAYLDAVLPVTIQQGITSDPVIPALVHQVGQTICRGPGDLPAGYAALAFQLKTLERRSDRLKALGHAVLVAPGVKWALYPPVGVLRRLFHRLDPTPTRNVWLWPLPLFALASYLYNLLLPVRRITRWGILRK